MPPLRLRTLLGALCAALVLTAVSLMLWLAGPWQGGAVPSGRALLWLAGLTTLATLAVGFALLRHALKPFETLTAAAARLGRGDFETPVTLARGAELHALAVALERSRVRLQALTSELGTHRTEAEAVLSGISEGVFGVDRERRLRYLNPQAARLLGTTSEAALGRFCGDVLRPRARDGVLPCEAECPILHARFRGTSQASEILERSGARALAVIITAARPAGGQQIQILREETPLETSRRLRDHVLANISHEFQTPLAAQRAALELLRDELGDAATPEALALLSSTERGGLRLTQLVENLLESVRIEAGQLELRRKTVALDEVVEEAAELAAPLFALREQRLEIALPFPAPVLTGDAPRLQQVLLNLLSNAHKYAPAGSTISLGAEVRGAHLALWVDDEGPGPPPGDEGAIFERFFRAREDEPEASGMGLGLAIVRSIVERHGGTVVAKSREPGARFEIVLPLEGPP